MIESSYDRIVDEEEWIKAYLVDRDPVCGSCEVCFSESMSCSETDDFW